MAERPTDRFIEALHALEERGDVERIASLFTEDAELRNPTDPRPHWGPEGARRFWGSYRRSFAEIHTEFRHVVEADGTAMLEWESRGRTSRGGPIRYDGVSVLEFEDDRVRGFRSYFDTRELAEQLARGLGPGGR